MNENLSYIVAFTHSGTSYQYPFSLTYPSKKAIIEGDYSPDVIINAAMICINDFLKLNDLNSQCGCVLDRISFLNPIEGDSENRSDINIPEERRNILPQ